MSESPTPRKRSLTVIRWVARLWSIASLLFILAFIVGESLHPTTTAPITLRDLVGLLFFPTGVCLGMILAWRWEGLGGAITVFSLLAFYAALCVMDGKFPRGPWFALVAAPGIPFLVCWLLSRGVRKPLGTLLLLLTVGCSVPAVAPTPVPPAAAPPLTPATTVPTDENRADGLSDEEIATLGSLEQVDDYPLYTMHYHGVYNQGVSSAEGVEWLVSANMPSPNLAASPPTSTWACSLFAALGDADNMLYGRNFDWEYSPAVLLFTDPPGGYAAVSMVDIAYLGFEGTKAGTVADLPLIERRALLNAPFMPFDGMNEHGLVVGMAAVPPGGMHPDPNKETIGSLMVIRKMLDHASNVDEAVVLLQSYNIDIQGGPPLHYLIADRSGRSALVEFYQGEMVVIPNETPWHLATNFLRASAGESAEGPVLSKVEGRCWRYDRIGQWLTEARGQLTTQDATDLLAKVSQEGTQWSVVYGMSTGDINVAMGRQYDNVHILHLGEE